MNDKQCKCDKQLPQKNPVTGEIMCMKCGLYTGWEVGGGMEWINDMPNQNKQEEWKEEFLKQFAPNDREFDECGNKQRFSASVSSVANFIEQTLHQEREKAVREATDNHFCCKYQTINPKDFCDHCLALHPTNKTKE